ncbi:MAG: metal ABC transporter ATP-binding protein [Patescibacteria group bacterium]|jgi:zinc transport system ATP-binding protein
MNNPVLSIENLSFSYGTTDVLNDISFKIDKGDFVALVGPNGAGKTTLIKVILGLENKYLGQIKLFGINAKRFCDWNKVGYLPQRVNTFNPLFPATVNEVVGLGLLSQKSYPKKFNKDDAEKIESILDFLGITDLKNRPIAELSGGQQQRVFLARALVSNPEFLIMDEPSTALDPETRDTFFKLIEKLNKEKGTTIVMITHDTTQVGQYANELLYLDKKIIFYGPFADFCHSPEMEKYFGHFAQHLICHQH